MRRFARLSTQDAFGVYMHGTRIGVVVDYKGGDSELGKDLAMHIAASRPVCVSEAEYRQNWWPRSGKFSLPRQRKAASPTNIVEKMVEGRVRKFLAEVTLVGQPFVKDPDITVGKLLEQKGAEVTRFMRLEVGEGIEKKSENFADEVMAQVRGD